VRKSAKLRPKEVKEYTIFYQQVEICVREEHGEGQFADWLKVWDCRIEPFFSLDRKRFPDGYNTRSFESNEAGIDAAKCLYAVCVPYSSGDTFGRSEGNLAVAYITACVDKATEVMAYINKEGKHGNFASKYGVYAPWEGYFEHLGIAYIQVLVNIEK
jgi:hypothetical protein